MGQGGIEPSEAQPFWRANGGPEGGGNKKAPRAFARQPFFKPPGQMRNNHARAKKKGRAGRGNMAPLCETPCPETPAPAEAGAAAPKTPSVKIMDRGPQQGRRSWVVVCALF